MPHVPYKAPGNTMNYEPMSPTEFGEPPAGPNESKMYEPYKALRPLQTLHVPISEMLELIAGKEIPLSWKCS